MELLQELNQPDGIGNSRRSSASSDRKAMKKSKNRTGGSEEESCDMIGVESGIMEESCDMIGVESGVLVYDDPFSDNLCIDRGGACEDGGTDGELDDEDCWSKDLDRDSDNGKDDPGGGNGSSGGCDVRHVIVSVVVLLLISGAIALAILTQGFMDDPVYEIKFARYYDDGMILQRASQRSMLWGTASIIDRANTTIIIDIRPSTEHIPSSSEYQADAQTSQHALPYKHRYITNVRPNVFGNVWRVALEPMTDPGPYDITVYFFNQPQFSATIRQVLFGDVWVCVNQNELQLDVDQLLNSSKFYKNNFDRSELLDKLSNVRFLSMTSAKSDMVSYELRGTDLPWTSLSEKLLDELYQLPEICLLFIVELSRTVNHPLALVTISYADSKMEEWMPPSALDSCYLHYTDSLSKIWNGMVNPMLHVQLKGLIFIPGELDSLSTYSRYYLYNCSFVELFSRWRYLAAAEVTKSLKEQQYLGGSGDRLIEFEKWNDAAKTYEDETLSSASEPPNKHFHIAIVQALPRSSLDRPKYSLGVAELRWAQTVNYGYLPNPLLKSSYIIPTIDLPPIPLPLPPPTTPSANDTADNMPQRPSVAKQQFRHRHLDVSIRLINSTLSIVYSSSMNSRLIPRPTSYSLRSDQRTLTLYFESPKSSRFHVLHAEGFEICCTNNRSLTCDTFPQNPSIISPVVVQPGGSSEQVNYRDWQPAPISSPTPSSRPLTPRTPSHDTLTLSTAGCSAYMHVVSVRYAWRDLACAYLKCAVYGPISSTHDTAAIQGHALPMIPFIYRGPMDPDGQKRTFLLEPIDLTLTDPQI